MTGRALVVQGDALHLPLPDGSVDLIVTSPPYWALRAYGAGPAEVGSEPTPAAYLAGLWAATAEMARVLKPTGSIFVDLGDKYSSAASGQNGLGKSTLGLSKGPANRLSTEAYAQRMNQQRGKAAPGVPEKSLMLLPERYRIGCVDQLGLIARAVIVWDKPNGLPESVTDRVRRSHEDWVHLVKQPRYYSATDEVREPYGEWAARADNWTRRVDSRAASGSGSDGTSYKNGKSEAPANPLGKLPGSVWSIPSEPLRLPDHLGVQHYAAFPSEWPRRLILGFSPPGICLDCGQGRVPVVDTQRPAEQTDRMGVPAAEISRTILGYACACTPATDHPGSEGRERNGQDYATETGRDAHPHGGVGMLPRTGPWREYHLDGWRAPPTRPAVVLDPFSGTGTTPMVARALGRIGVGVDLSFPYCRAARWRIHHNAGKAISRTNLERQGSLL